MWLSRLFSVRAFGKAGAKRQVNRWAFHGKGCLFYLYSGLPLDKSQFELFDLDTDFGVTNNLVETNPEKCQELLSLCVWNVRNLASC